jgi:photosystem II stability/assembly factor-like uncharacterized protein
MVSTMENRQHALTGNILLLAFVALLGSYFWMSYSGHQAASRIQEKQLTAHDDLFAIDERHDGNSAAVGKFGLILLTRDGGKTWKAQPSGTVRALSAISFADHEHGYVVGSGGIVLASSDGGASWKAQTSGTKDQLLGVHALNSKQVYAVGAFGTLLSTSDGGVTWRRQELSWEKLIPNILKESGLLEPNLSAIQFVNEKLGWIVGEFGLVLQTRDGGETWSAQNYGENLPQLFAVFFRDEQTGWAVGQLGTLMRTVDGGKHWARVAVETDRNLNGISMDGDRGMIVGDGVVLASDDGGLNWRKLASAPEDRWLTGVAMKRREAIAVGQAGTIRVLNLGDNVSKKETEAR